MGRRRTCATPARGRSTKALAACPAQPHWRRRSPGRRAHRTPAASPRSRECAGAGGARSGVRPGRALGWPRLAHHRGGPRWCGDGSCSAGPQPGRSRAARGSRSPLVRPSRGRTGSAPGAARTWGWRGGSATEDRQPVGTATALHRTGRAGRRKVLRCRGGTACRDHACSGSGRLVQQLRCRGGRVNPGDAAPTAACGAGPAPRHSESGPRMARPVGARRGVACRVVWPVAVSRRGRRSRTRPRRSAALTGRRRLSVTRRVEPGVGATGKAPQRQRSGRRDVAGHGRAGAPGRSATAERVVSGRWRIESSRTADSRAARCCGRGGAATGAVPRVVRRRSEDSGSAAMGAAPPQ